MARIHDVASPSTPIRRASPWATAIAAAILRVADGLAFYRQHLRERRALDRMDDHMLRDIGIRRADIGREANSPFWRA
jgi:uncharacterized protein YjiS (DUF1127 family)